MENYRKYGIYPYTVAVLHGGPGAAGEMAPVAKELSKARGILEPFQTKHTINGQVEELHSFLIQHADIPVTLIGYSWGAWLGYIFSADHPGMVKKLILIGSGPFEEKYAVDIMRARLGRLKEDDRREVEVILASLGKNSATDNNRLMSLLGRLILRADSYDIYQGEQPQVEINFEIYDSVWNEAEKLRNNGRLLELAASIKCPVTAVHGDHDPHPAAGVDIPLSRVLKDFRFILLNECGHEPWLEKKAREKFYDILKNEID